MNINWYKSEGTQETAPAPVNLDWSKTYVYLHRNVERVTKTLEDGTTHEVWEYEEAMLTRADYAIYLGEQNAANIDYLAVMTDVDM